MADPDLTSSERKQQFNSAATHYDSQVLLRGAIAFVSFFLTTALLAFVVRYFQPEIHHGLGLKMGTEDCPGAINPILIYSILLLSICFPLCFFYRQVKELRQKTAPLCPFCHLALGQHSSRAGVVATGFCPACKRKLFEGELNSEASAVAKYEKTKSEVRRYTLFTCFASMCALLIVLPVYSWLYSTGQLPGTDLPSLVKVFMYLPLLFTVLPFSLWWVGRLSVRDQQNILELYRAGEQNSGIIKATRSAQESQQ